MAALRWSRCALAAAPVRVATATADRHRPRTSRQAPAAGDDPPHQVRRSRTSRRRRSRASTAGFAYAFAEDNICTIANEYVTVAGKRSQYFGPDESWYVLRQRHAPSRTSTPTTTSSGSSSRGSVAKLMKTPPPLGPKKGVRKGVTGYVAGYNAYLADTGVDKIPDPACRGADWVRKIKQRDVYRRFYQLGILASSGAVIDGIVGAKPSSRGAAPSEQQAAAGRDARAAARALADAAARDRLQRLRARQGGDRQRQGHGARQPPLPLGRLRAPLPVAPQIPGKLDVSGGSLDGVPLVLIGHTRGLAWSHTVATAWRFTPFKLTLPPRRSLHLRRRRRGQADGGDRGQGAESTPTAARPSTRTIYSTEYGPMISDLVGMPLPWSDGTGFALARRQRDQLPLPQPLLRQQQGADGARVRPDPAQATRASPGSTRIAADSSGEAYYSMQGAIPYVPDELAAECNVGRGRASRRSGCRSSTARARPATGRTEGDAVAPGTFPPDEVPTIFRDDYVHNGNDSHWLTNPEAPLTGLDRIIGIENAERTFRTRLGPDPGRGAARRHRRPARQPASTARLLQKVALGNRQYLGELWRDSLVSFCDAAPGGFLHRLATGRSTSRAPATRCATGTCTTTSTPTARSSSAASPPTCSATSPCLPTGLQGSTCARLAVALHDPVHATPTRSTPPQRPQHRQPAGRAGPCRRRHRSRGRRDPARRAAARLPVRDPGRRADPDPRRPRRPRRLQRDQRRLEPEEGGYTDVRHGSSFIMAAQFEGRPLPGRGRHLRHLRRVREPGLPPRGRLHQGLLAASAGIAMPFCGATSAQGDALQRRSSR